LRLFYGLFQTKRQQGLRIYGRIDIRREVERQRQEIERLHAELDAQKK
jgi:hypothetical protein